MTQTFNFGNQSVTCNRAVFRRLAVILLPALIILFAAGCNRNRLDTLFDGIDHQYPGLMPEVVVRPIPDDTLPTVLVTAPRPEKPEQAVIGRPGRPVRGRTQADISMITPLTKGANQ